MTWSRRSTAGLAVLATVAAWRPLAAQHDVATASSETATATRLAAVELLARRVTMTVSQATIAHAIDVAARAANVALQYDTHVVGAFRSLVSVRVTNVPLRVVLDRILAGTTLTVVPDGQTRLAIIDTRVTDLPDDSTGVLIGVVSEEPRGTPVFDATVSLQGTKFAARTGPTGRFVMIGVPPGGYIIVARRLGHLSQERRISIHARDTTRVQLQLTPVPSILQDVITTGAGDRTKLEVGNAISTINADSIVQNTPIRTMSDLLNGRAAGLDVLPSGGTAGAGSKIRIRGLSSLMSSEDPVVIVDGIRFDDAYTRARGTGYGIPALNAAASYVPASSRLDDIDPESIESIDVLKGPAASALYGSDAANGVIVVKTKHGRPGPTRWLWSGQQGRSTQEATYPEPYYGWGKQYGVIPSPTTCTLANVAALTCQQDSVTHYNPLNHSATSPFRPGWSHQLNGQVSGGTDRQQYFVSATYENEQGVLAFPSALRVATLKQLNGNPIPSWSNDPNFLNALALSSTLTSEFGSSDIALSLNGRRQYHRDVAEGGTGFVLMGSEAPGYRDTLYQGWGSTSAASVFLGRSDEMVSRGWGSLSGNWRPIRVLTVHGTGGVDYSSSDDQTLLPQNVTLQGSFSGRGHYVTSNFLKTGDANATLELPLAPSLISQTTGGTQYTSASVDQLSGSASTLPAGSVTLSGASSVQANEYLGDQVTVGWYLQQQFSFNQRLFLTAAVRGDKSSAFGGSNNTVAYPKWNASWLISQEPFFPKIAALNSLRLRVGYGHAGENPSYESRFRTYLIIAGYANGASSNTIGLNSVGNSDILPERSVETEGGFDLGLMDDRMTVGFTLASKITHNALMSRTLPPSFGPSVTQVQNVGNISNRNVELEATVRPLVASALSWSTTFVMSQTFNRVLSLGTAQPTPPLGPTSTGAQNRFVPGYPVDGIWTRAILSYTDVNQDGILEANEIRYADSTTYVGDYEPKHRLGWQNNVSFLSGIVSLGANFTYEGDALQYNSLLLSMCLQHVCRGAVDPSAPLDLQAQALSVLTSSWAYLEHVSTFRFEEMSLTFAAPPSLVRSLHSQRVSISLMARNLKFWSHYRGADPEVNTYNGGGDGVTDGGTVPQPRSWTVRVNLGY